MPLHKARKKQSNVCSTHANSTLPAIRLLNTSILYVRFQYQILKYYIWI
jgi:hypothetical protein